MASCQEHWELATSLFRSITSPDLVSLNSQICAEGPRWVRALQQLCLLRRLGLQGDVVTESALAAAAQRGLCWRMASQLQRSGMAMNALAASFQALGRWTAALQLAQGRRPDSAFWVSMVCCASQRGHWPLALSFLQEHVESSPLGLSFWP